MSNESNVTNIRKEDKDFIRVVTTLAPDKIALIKGIVIGMQLQDIKSAPIEPVQTLRC